MILKTSSKCMCGDSDCWPRDDYSWLSSRSGWSGDINGCPSSVFFIHGRKIREQRHIPEGSWSIAELAERLPMWANGLPDARLFWTSDTGGGDAGLWIEGVREPTAIDWKRLDEARARQDAEDRQTFTKLKARYETPAAP